eukprot:4224478-Pleurochrysis_carterae.AAC.3
MARAPVGQSLLGQRSARATAQPHVCSTGAAAVSAPRSGSTRRRRSGRRRRTLMRCRSNALDACDRASRAALARFTARSGCAARLAVGDPSQNAHTVQRIEACNLHRTCSTQHEPCNPV